MPGASRACRATHVVPRPRGDGEPFVRAVRAATETGRYDVVLGGGDDWVAALSSHRDRIPATVAHPDLAVVERALDKVHLAEAAAATGLRAPVTVAGGAALRSWRGPVVVKCRAHWTPGQTHPHRIDARLFPDAEAARPQVERIERAGAQVVLQEPVAGRLGALVGVFHGGRLHGCVQQESQRLWPSPYGASARARTVEVDRDLVVRSEAVLGEIGWSGLVEMQFLTGADGVPHLSDLNGRFYGSLALAEAARPGLVDTWVRTVLGEPMPELGDGAPGVRYSWIAGDLRRARLERRGGLVGDVLDTARAAVGAEHSVWRLRDPGPALHVLTERFRRGVPRGRTGRDVGSTVGAAQG
jgi:predicted ATP-grasp superfamily ATP-dependent carboligase